MLCNKTSVAAKTEFVANFGHIFSEDEVITAVGKKSTRLTATFFQPHPSRKELSIKNSKLKIHGEHKRGDQK
jgi:hypothetical protein